MKSAAPRATSSAPTSPRTRPAARRGAYGAEPGQRGEVPIWIADYVIDGYGTGAIMAVPAHDHARLRVRREVRASDRRGRHGGGLRGSSTGRRLPDELAD